MKEDNRAAADQAAKIIPIQWDATFFFERAVRSMDRYHYDKALKYFRRAVEYEPENPVNHCNLAGILSEMGQYEESNRILVEILETLDPLMTECFFLYGQQLRQYGTVREGGAVAAALPRRG